MTHRTVWAGKYSTTLHLEVDVGALTNIFSACHLSLRGQAVLAHLAAPAIPATPPAVNAAQGKACAGTQDASQTPGTWPDAH